MGTGTAEGMIREVLSEDYIRGRVLQRMVGSEDIYRLAQIEKIARAFDGPQMVNVRHILSPEWLHGRILPAYVGAAERARVAAIRQLLENHA